MQRIGWFVVILFLTWITKLPDFSTYSAQVEVISMVTGKHKTLAKLSGDYLGPKSNPSFLREENQQLNKALQLQHTLREAPKKTLFRKSSLTDDPRPLLLDILRKLFVIFLSAGFRNLKPSHSLESKSVINIARKKCLCRFIRLIRSIRSTRSIRTIRSIKLIRLIR